LNTKKKTDLAFKIFRAAGESAWEVPMKAAVEFAATLDRHQLVNLSHSSDHGSGTVVVWYVKNPAE
jgi:hypothetical protein